MEVHRATKNDIPGCRGNFSILRDFMPEHPLEI
jgi:hypothetical protein